MNDIQELLIQKYDLLRLKNPEVCLKISYQYHQVNVNLYFDYYGDTFNLYLILSYGIFLYYTPLNIDILKSKDIYLDDLPREIREKILDDNKKLKEFYIDMRNHMSNDNFERGDYGKDIVFRNGINSNRNKDKNPFFHYLRNTTMTDEHLKSLLLRFNISENILKTIQKQGFTIATTANSKYRKELTLILEKHGIKL